MLVIGLTGGIGSGKTTVANIFLELGVPIIDADIIARDVTTSNSDTVKTIAAHFGADILENNQLNRGKLRERIFSNPKDRAWLEALLHPLIIAQIKVAIAASNAPYCIVAIPLLIETGPYDFIDRILVVDTDESTQLSRITARDNMSTTQAKSMIEAQASRTARKSLADDIIENDRDLAHLTTAVKTLHQRYLELAAESGKTDPKLYL